MTNTDIFEGKSYKEIIDLKEKADEKLKWMRKDRLKELKKKITEMIKDEDFTVKEVFPSSSSKSSDENSDDIPKRKRVAKKQYKNPDTGVIHKGFGRKPAWLKDENGEVIEDYLIKEENPKE